MVRGLFLRRFFKKVDGCCRPQNNDGCKMCSLFIDDTKKEDMHEAVQLFHSASLVDSNDVEERNKIQFTDVGVIFLNDIYEIMKGGGA